MNIFLFIILASYILVFLKPRYAPYLIVSLVPIMPKILLQGGPVSTISLEDYIVIPVIASYVMRSRFTIKIDAVFISYLLFILCIVFITFGNYVLKNHHTNMQIALIVKMILPFLILVMANVINYSDSEIRRLLYLLFIFSIPIALLGIFQHYKFLDADLFVSRYYPLYGDVLAGTKYYSYRGATSTFDGHHLLSGGYYAMISILSLWFFYNPFKIFNRLFIGTVTLLNIYALVLTFSRSAILITTLGVGIIIINNLLKSKPNIAKTSILALALISAILISYGPTQIDLIAKRWLMFDYTSVRGSVWGWGLNMYLDAPIFGYGLFDISWFEAHNGYLQIALSGGFLPLIMQVVVLYYIAYKGYKSIDDNFIGWLMVLISIFIVFDISSQFLFNWGRGRVQAILWLLIGISIYKREDKANQLHTK